jgi:hypothetical protein
MDEAHTRNDRLDSWKEIAAYLGRDVRTVTRWEKLKGLPVHRIPGGRRHAVFSYRAELEAWLNPLESRSRSLITVRSMLTTDPSSERYCDSFNSRFKETDGVDQPFGWPFE